MSIKDEISVYPTHRRHNDDFKPMVDVSRERQDASIQYGIGLVSEYMVDVHVRVKFCCNNAQLSEAENRARKQLVRALYREQLSIVDEIRNAVFSGSRPKALEALDELTQSMQA